MKSSAWRGGESVLVFCGKWFEREKACRVSKKERENREKKRVEEETFFSLPLFSHLYRGQKVVQRHASAVDVQSREDLGHLAARERVAGGRGRLTKLGRVEPAVAVAVIAAEQGDERGPAPLRLGVDLRGGGARRRSASSSAASSRRSRSFPLRPLPQLLLAPLAPAQGLDERGDVAGVEQLAHERLEALPLVGAGGVGEAGRGRGRPGGGGGGGGRRRRSPRRLGRRERARFAVAARQPLVVLERVLALRLVLGALREDGAERGDLLAPSLHGRRRRRGALLWRQAQLVRGQVSHGPVDGAARRRL